MTASFEPEIFKDFLKKYISGVTSHHAANFS